MKKFLAASVMPLIAPTLIAQGTLYGPQQVISTAADFATSAFAADLDGDGDIDVLSASRTDDKISLYPNDGAGNFGPQEVISTAADGPVSVYATDFDADGDLDVISASAFDNTIAWYEFSGTPTTSTATQYGVGCGTPPMLFTPTSTAIAGTAITAEVTNTPTPFCFVTFGNSNTSALGLGSLPLALDFVGMPGCNLYQSGDVWGLSTTGAGIAFQMNFAIGVPPDPLIIGQHFYFQAFSVAPGANALEVLATNGIDFLIGNQ